MRKLISIFLIGLGLLFAAAPAAVATGGPPNNSCSGDNC